MMSSYLIKSLVLAFLVQLAFSATYRKYGCEDGVAHNTTYYRDGCISCTCYKGLMNPETGVKSQDLEHCVSCGSASLDCENIVLAHPDAHYPACCELKCLD